MEDSFETVPTEPILNLNCRFCKFIASNTEVLFKHETSHYKEPPVEFRSSVHSCHKCSKVFYNRSHLQSHLYTHDSAKHFACNICHKSFRHSSSLARHRRSHKLQNKSLHISDTYSVANVAIKCEVLSDDSYLSSNDLCKTRSVTYGMPRLFERHFPSLIPPTNKKEHPTKICTVCNTQRDSQGKRKRRESRYMCKICNWSEKDFNDIERPSVP
ncbi:hypothetical protein JTE90_007173 [Oedothorax gibbosus]|uniref:C2H2-type domain-containing protein n=1 Tax=Oedothorax gibbosus TaxID=931172 RepID=A0AAV6UZ63_9ARAC|nr:hypothetical protein JTE90_007173 [Oedothorax gibbosus]